jgi:hypothetical protein
MKTNWANLIRWLEVVYRDYEIPFPLVPTRASPGFGIDTLIVGMMSMVVKRMREQPWEVVTELLEELHCVLIATDERWR